LLSGLGFDTDFTSHEILLADKGDGKPLVAKEGPWRIVVPRDKRPGTLGPPRHSFKIVAVN
jgi:hypothetical protein